MTSTDLAVQDVSSSLSLAHPRLPRWAPALVAVLAVAAAGLPALLLGWGVVPWLALAVVLAVMIIPIITALCREIFLQTPRLNEEAALALGATRWEMIRLTVFPYARSGMVSAVMLGLGRALGETMAVAMVLSASPVVTLNLISNTNPATVASNIASSFSEATPDKLHVLIATGLVLFAVTFAVNFAARWVVGRSERRMSR